MLDRGPALNQIIEEPRQEIAEDDVDAALAIVDDLRRQWLVTEKLVSREQPARQRTEWEQLPATDKLARLEVVRTILPLYANLEVLQKYWYDLRSRIETDVYPADFIQLQRDALAITATARFFIERGYTVRTANTDLDANRPNALWVEPGLQSGADGRERVWAVRVQVEPFSFNIPQLVRAGNYERPDEVTSGFGANQTAQSVMVRDIQFNFPDKNDALLRTLDPLTGAWQLPAFKAQIDKQFAVYF